MLTSHNLIADWLKDGEIALRNLDFAAHTSLIEAEFFQQHIIPAKAKVLADRLSDTLASVLSTEEGPGDSHSTVLRSWSTKKSQIVEIFELASRIKAKATVRKDWFEMVFYAPGSLFDKDVMEAETMEGDGAMVPFSTASEVKLCLLPSLHVYGHDRMLVDCNNFVRRHSSRRAGATIITKAVVVL